MPEPAPLRLLSLAAGGKPTVGIEADGVMLDGARLLREILGAEVASLSDVVQGGLFDDAPMAEVAAAARGKKADKWHLTGPVLLLPPVEATAKVIACGRNYPAHAAERKKPLPPELVYFQKPGSALTAAESDIVVPSWYEGQVDHEAELGLVIGKRAKDLRPETALACVAGYTVVNDVTARTLQDADIKRGWPWFRGKGLDTFCPIGPGIVPRSEIADPQALRVTCRVNGKVRQDGATADMNFKIPQLLAEITRALTLFPGDVVSTGTPGGVGPIKPGDVVECEVSPGVGVLRNRVVKR